MSLQTHTHELLDYLLTVKHRQDMAQVLESLLTPAEFTEIANRLQIFKMLKAGLPHRRIAEELGVGIATVSRGSRALGRLSPEVLERLDREVVPPGEPEAVSPLATPASNASETIPSSEQKQKPVAGRLANSPAGRKRSSSG